MDSITTRIGTLIRNMHSGILVEDQHRMIALVNQEFCDIFSIPVEPELLVGTDCTNSAEQSMNLFQEPEKFLKRIEQILIEKIAVTGEELTMANGRVLERDYIPIMLQNKFLGNLWQYRDVTFLKQAEQRLQESEYRYRQIIDQVNDLIYRITPDGYFTFINKVGERITGSVRSEILGRHYLDFIRPDYRESVAGEVIQFIGYGLDTTDLIQARKVAEDSTKAKNLFLATMSHEIRTPLNAIIGLSRLMQGTGLTEEQQGLNSKLIIAGESLLLIINDILDFSKIEAGKISIEAIPFSVKELLKRVYSFHENAAEERMISLVVDADPDLPGAVVGDSLRLQQVLTNLVSNAIKFTREGGVRLQCRIKGVSEEKVSIRFAIIDTGIGIGQENLGTIFEKFRQEDNSVTRNYGGTGLGLATSAAVLQGMFGELVQWFMLSFLIIAILIRIPMWGKVVIIAVGVFLILLVQSTKEEYRMATWYASSSKSNSEIYNEIILSRLSSPSTLFESGSMGNSAARLNQAWIIARIMNYMPKYQPFVRGETIETALVASLLPRFLAPTKAKAGGRANFERFTGTPLPETTSMDISLVGEGYANFGFLGGMAFIFLVSLMYNWVIIKVISLSKNNPTLIVWIPFLFFQVMKAETDFATVFNYLTKAALVTFLVFYISKVIMEQLLVRPKRISALPDESQTGILS